MLAARVAVVTQNPSPSLAPQMNGAAGFNVLDDHVNHCVAEALASGDSKSAEEKSRELLDAVQRFARTR